MPTAAEKSGICDSKSACPMGGYWGRLVLAFLVAALAAGACPQTDLLVAGSASFAVFGRRAHCASVSRSVSAITNAAFGRPPAMPPPPHTRRRLRSDIIRCTSDSGH